MKIPDVPYAVGQWRREHPGQDIADGHPAAQHPGLPQPRRIRRRQQDQEGSLTESSALSVKAGQPQWDLRIFVSTALEKTVERAVIRERRVSCPVEVERRWRERYIPSQQFYFATVRPTDHANIIVRNDEPQQPVRETQTRSPQPGIG